MQGMCPTYMVPTQIIWCLVMIMALAFFVKIAFSPWQWWYNVTYMIWNLIWISEKQNFGNCVPGSFCCSYFACMFVLFGNRIEKSMKAMKAIWIKNTRHEPKWTSWTSLTFRCNVFEERSSLLVTSNISICKYIDEFPNVLWSMCYTLIPIQTNNSL